MPLALQFNLTGIAWKATRLRASRAVELVDSGLPHPSYASAVDVDQTCS